MAIIPPYVTIVNTDCKKSKKSYRSHRHFSSSTICHKFPFISELIAQPPAAPDARTSGRRAGVSPPMAKIGKATDEVTSRRKVRPRGARPGLHEVA